MIHSASNVRAISLLLLVAHAPMARAQAGDLSETSHAAVARGPEIISAPTAWLMPNGRLHAAARLDNKVQPSIALHYGLGGLAELGLSLDRSYVWCETCTGEQAVFTSVDQVTASLKLGVDEDQLGRGWPAMAVHLRRTLARDLQPLAGEDPGPAGAGQSHESVVATGMATRSVGPFALHAGAVLLAAERPDGQTSVNRVRPAAGLEWRPARYPRSTVQAELLWLPRAGYGAGVAALAPVWNASWGGRYQVFDWASVQLSVRHQQGEAFENPIISFGVAGTFDLAPTPAAP